MLRFETYNTIYLCKQSIILADPYVNAGMEMSAALPNKNITSQNKLPVCALRSKAFRLAVTPVPGRAYAFLVRK